MHEPHRAVFYAGVRTPFTGRGGELKDLSTLDLAALVVGELVERSEIDPQAVERVVLAQGIPRAPLLVEMGARGLRFHDGTAPLPGRRAAQRAAAGRPGPRLAGCRRRPRTRPDPPRPRRATGPPPSRPRAPVAGGAHPKGVGGGGGPTPPEGTAGATRQPRGVSVGAAGDGNLAAIRRR
jgi:hypothetical protein